MISFVSTCSTCNSGVWNCTQKICDSTCYIYGGNIQTFDGAAIYFNGGDCTYSLIEPSAKSNNSDANIRITMGTIFDKTSITSDTQYLLQPRILTVTFNGETVKLIASKSGQCRDVSVELNGKSAKNL
jgi:hypothetical protein